MGHMADAAVEGVGGEGDAVRLELGAGGTDILDVQRDRVRVRLKLKAERVGLHDGDGQGAVSNSAAGMRPHRAEHGMPSTVP